MYFCLRFQLFCLFYFSDIERIREGIGYKFSIVTQYLSSFVSGIAVGFYVNWRLTSVLLGVGPFVIGTAAAYAKVFFKKIVLLIFIK